MRRIDALALPQRLNYHRRTTVKRAKEFSICPNKGPTEPPARTPGAKRAGAGEYVFDLASINHILGGPDYSTANGACVEGDRMIVGLMRMPAGTGAGGAFASQ